MARPSVSIPDWMLEELDQRNSRPDRSKWIREAIVARFDAEDAGEWTTPEMDGRAEEYADA